MSTSLMSKKSIFVLAVVTVLVAASSLNAAKFQGPGDLESGSFYSRAHGISADGLVVVGQSTSSSGTEAFRWTASGGMVGLGDLAGGTFNSSANKASADGSVVVGGGRSASGPEACTCVPGNPQRTLLE